MDRIISNQPVAQDIWRMEIESKAVDAAQPGQFVHVKVPNAGHLLLRRPISIGSVHDGQLTLVYQIKGEGTRCLAQCQTGDELDVLGPLGHGFGEAKGKVALIGGGIGAAPLLYLLEQGTAEYHVFLGFRSAAHAYMLNDFAKGAREITLCSDDGTLGHKGFVTDALNEALASGGYEAVYACGPLPMFRSLQKVMKGYDIPCYVSLEERMGCGIGGCLVCSCKIRTSEGWQYKRVCADGPVFEIGEVDFDD